MLEKFRLDNKLSMVTGGSKGIGFGDTSVRERASGWRTTLLTFPPDNKPATMWPSSWTAIIASQQKGRNEAMSMNWFSRFIIARRRSLSAERTYFSVANETEVLADCHKPGVDDLTKKMQDLSKLQLPCDPFQNQVVWVFVCQPWEILRTTA